MKLSANFYRPLAIGAPLPLRELPVRPERMIHFFPPHVEKIRARIPEMAKQIDVLCGNLEDAIPIDAKEAARAGFIAVAQSTDFGGTALWTRVNALNSPWFLDDVLEIVAAVGNKLDVIIVPKVEGPWDIHFVDQLLAQLEARQPSESGRVSEAPRLCRSGSSLCHRRNGTKGPGAAASGRLSSLDRRRRALREHLEWVCSCRVARLFAWLGSC